MPSAIKAGILYFAIVFAAGFLLGTLRLFILLPLTGEFAAVALELPVMLIISWLACRRLVARFSVPAMVSQRLAMGVLAFCLLMLAEVGLSVLEFNRSGLSIWHFCKRHRGCWDLPDKLLLASFLSCG